MQVASQHGVLFFFFITGASEDVANVFRALASAVLQEVSGCGKHYQEVLSLW